jgi:triphosphoribosyl-dephospho-CoA synthetase
VSSRSLRLALARATEVLDPATVDRIVEAQITVRPGDRVLVALAGTAPCQAFNLDLGDRDEAAYRLASLLEELREHYEQSDDHGEPLQVAADLLLALAVATVNDAHLARARDFAAWRVSGE